jgi:HSP20 family protein
MRLRPWRKQAELARETEASPLRRFREEMDQLFDSFFGGTRLGEWPFPGASGGWIPEIELIEGEKDFVVRAEVPGLDPKDIEVSVTGNHLTLSGEKKEDADERKEGYYHSERRFGSFYRSLELPAGTTPESITAEYDKGVLTLRIAKAEEATAQRIPVRAAEKGTAGSAPEAGKDAGTASKGK